MEGKSKAFKYTMFGLLYFSQGTILSYFTALNALYLQDNGIDMGRIGILGTIAMIPFILKIFLGLLSDKVNLFGKGHRKPYILIGLAIQVVSLLVVSAIDPSSNFTGFVVMAFMVQFGMALYDTCTDGLALDTIPKEEEGTIQTFMVGGRAVGLIATATIVGLIADNLSWNAVFYALAIFTLFPLPFVLMVKDGERPAGRRFDPKAFKAFGKRNVLAISGIGFIIFFIIVGVNQIINPYMRDGFGISLSQAGMLTTVWGIGILIGSVFGGKIFDSLDKKTVTYIGMGLSLFSLIGFALVPSLIMAWIFMFIFGFSYGTYQTVYFAMAMNITEASIAASMFSILMSITNLGQAVGMGISGGAVDAIGYKLTLVIFAALNFLLLPLLRPAFKPKETE